jgi:hypothetical protein
MPGSDTPLLHQTVTNPSRTGWNGLIKTRRTLLTWRVGQKVVTRSSRDCLTRRLQMQVLQLLLGLHGARSTRIPGAVSGRITTVAPLLCVHPAGSRNQ